MFLKSMKMKNLNWIFIAVLLIAAMLYAATSIHTVSAQVTTASVFISPSSSVFTNPTVGTTFNVSVTIANVTGLAGAQWSLSWNASLLSCVGMTENLYHTVTPSDDWSNIWDLALKYNNTAGTASYAQAWLDIPTAESDGYCPANINATTYPPNGSLAFAIFTFNITSVPATNMISQCSFTLTGMKLSDVNAASIANTVTNGNYEVIGPPQTTVTAISNTWTGITDNVTTVTNATLVPSSMTFNNNTYTLSFNLTGTEGTTGYVNVTVPTDLISLNKTTDLWNVTVNGTSVTPIISSNATDTFFYITTTFSTVPITIQGTLPEFTALMMIPLLATATMVAIVFRKRRRI